jgi:Fe-S cluster assembly protein SufD
MSCAIASMPTAIRASTMPCRAPPATSCTGACSPGKSRAVFNGKAIVHPGAAGTDARQSNANLLLSPEAEVDTKPELEIYADDVKCAHGATTGQLDAAALFYLRSRGIDEGTAKSLLTFAFADTVLARMALLPLRRHAEQLVVGRLPDADRIREFT